MFVVTYRKVFYGISVVLIALSVFAVAYWGLNFGIDFKGGSIIEVSYTPERPSQEEVQEHVTSLSLGEALVRPAGDDSYIIRTRTLTEPERQMLTSSLLGTNGTSSATTSAGSAQIKRFDSVGPILGAELQSKAIWSIVLVILAIILFITFAFRRVSEPVASWKYGSVAIIALFHDVIVPTGLFAYLGRNGGYEIDALFITAILVILGFSVHDSIVVFDRTRENLQHNTGKKSFADVVGESISQTFSRSINTSLTTILALLAVYFIGPEATRTFSLALVVGIAVGTYSSIFIGSPLLVTLQKFQKKGR